MTLISVIVAAYNASETLKASLDSILNQAHKNLEIIVVDDCSKDNTLAVAYEAQARDTRIKIIALNENGGPAAARNAAIGIARGEWIAIVDSDDTILPERLSVMLALNADIVFDNLFFIETDGSQRLYIPSTLDISGPLSLQRYIESHLRSCEIPNLGFLKPLIRRTVLGGLRYDEALTVGEDAMLIVELMARGAKAILTQEPFYQYRRREGSLSISQTTDDMRASYNAFRIFLHNNPDLPERSALESLLRHSHARIQARDAVERIMRGDFRGLGNLNHRTWPFFIREAGSKVKRSLRF